MRYVLSDIHGCYDAYSEMLEKIKLTDEDTLYILGDVIDRGENGIKILKDVMHRENVVMLKGNHEKDALYVLPKLLGKKECDAVELTDNELDYLNL